MHDCIRVSGGKDSTIIYVKEKFNINPYLAISNEMSEIGAGI